MSVCILEKTKNTDKLIITGSKIGIICGKESKINFRKIRNGKPLPTISSINWTLFAKQNKEIIKMRINKELLNSCLIIYLSTKFIEYLEKNNIHYLLQILTTINTSNENIF